MFRHYSQALILCGGVGAVTHTVGSVSQTVRLFRHLNAGTDTGSPLVPLLSNRGLSNLVPLDPPLRKPCLHEVFISAYVLV